MVTISQSETHVTRELYILKGALFPLVVEFVIQQTLNGRVHRSDPPDQHAGVGIRRLEGCLHTYNSDRECCVCDAPLLEKVSCEKGEIADGF